MADDTNIKLAYNAQTFAVRAEFAVAQALMVPEPPASLVERAQKKLETIAAAGQVICFKIYPEKLKDIWQAIHRDKPVVDGLLDIVIGMGCPDLPGVKYSPSTQPGILGCLSIEAPKDKVQSWKPEWVKIYFAYQLEKMKIPGTPSMAHIFSAWYAASKGEKIQNVPIPSLEFFRSQRKDPEKTHIFYPLKGRDEIFVAMFTLSHVQTAENLEKFLATCQATAKKFAETTGKNITFSKNYVGAVIKHALLGPERFGLDLPLTVLVAQMGSAEGAATDHAKVAGQSPAVQTSEASPAATGGAVAAPQDYPGKGLLKIEISEDKMTATVPSPLESLPEGFKITGDWIKKELKGKGIVLGIKEDVVKMLVPNLEPGEKLKPTAVATGDPGLPAKEPYVYPSYKDAKTKSKSDSETVDIRSMQQKNILSEGDLIAEIRYNSDPRPGKNLFGEELPPPPNEPINVTVGEGVEERGGKYYSKGHGMPEVKDKSISLLKVLQHQGDVNLSSGNIEFTGSAEITGAIDSGAYVNISGDLAVKGGIRGGFVVVGGTLTVEGGVTTGETGKILCRGDVKTDFIQNSNISCEGNVLVNKVIIASKIVAGKGIEIGANDGLIAGGTIHCRENVRAANVGQPAGVVTVIHAGVDSKMQERYSRIQSRLEKVQKKNQEDRQNMRELLRKSTAQMTHRHEDMKENLKDRVARGSALVTKLQDMVTQSKGKLSFNADAKVFVANRLCTNCKVEVGGHGIPIPNDVAGVVLVARKIGGSHVVSIEEFEEREKRKEEDDKQGTKKAS